MDFDRYVRLHGASCGKLSSIQREKNVRNVKIYRSVNVDGNSARSVALDNNLSATQVLSIIKRMERFDARFSK